MSASGTRHTPILLALAFLLPACQWDVGTLEVQLVYTAVNENSPVSSFLISRLRTRIKGDGMSTREIKIDIRSDESGVLSEIPVGKNRVLTVEGLDDQGFIKSRGISMPFDTKSGNTKIYLFISRVGKFSEPPLGGTIGTGFTDEYQTKLSNPTRVFHTATLLPSGDVLLVGGALIPSESGFLTRVEDAFRDAALFDTTAGAFYNDIEFRDCSNGRLCINSTLGRARHSAELLPGGTHVVVFGGEPVDTDMLKGGEYYSIETRTFENYVEIGLPRSRHASAVLTGSQEGVLVAGGAGTAASVLLDSIEMFEAGSFRKLRVELSEPRSGPVAVALSDGVLVIGGWRGTNDASDTVDYIKFAGGNPEVKPFPMQQARAEHSAVLLQDPGEEVRVLVCGGLWHDGFTMRIANTCELLYPDREGTKSKLLELTVERWGHTATVLQDGRVLIAGGFYAGQAPLQAKGNALLFDTSVGVMQPREIVMVSPRAGHTATLLPNGMVLLVGGASSMVQPDPQEPSYSFVMALYLYEIFNPPLE